MNVIFLTMSNMHGVEDRGIYADLMRKFRDEGHQVHIVAPRERRTGEQTSLQEVDGVQVLGVRTLNLQKTNVIEKGAGQVLVESQFKSAIKKYLDGVKFDLILYSTPPITLMGAVKYLKKLNPQARTYLLLKDIFPQNAVDIGMMSKTGVKGLLYKHFRKQEKQLYKVSDYIGCMSPANVEFIRKHNSYYPADRVEVAPNSIEAPIPPKGENFEEEEKAKKAVERRYIRDKYRLPIDKPIFIYGGNLGRPQGIDFLIQCLDANKHRDDCFFVVVGNGTRFQYLESQISQMKERAQIENLPFNIKLMQRLPKEDYDMLVRSCDVGLIFLDHRFTIPNYPSRLLGYLEYQMPVICATDPNTDIGRIAEDNGYGYWCESNDVSSFTALVDKILAADRKAMGQRGYEFLKANYTVQNTYDVIMKHFK